MATRLSRYAIIADHTRSGIEILARVIEQALRIGLAQPGREAFAYRAALPVTPVGIEPVADDSAPSRTTVITATRLVVIREKSM
jgi:hypothetical protein